MHPYIIFEGVIGVGKTTLARLLQSRFQSELLLEAFDENPFLSNFYSDRVRYAFQTQIFFLLSRYQQQQVVPRLLRRRPVLADYFFEKDKLFAHLNITGDELVMYDHLYMALAEKVRRPDLVVYLRANVDILMARIAMRDRPYERQMDRAYIAALVRAYEMLFSHYESAPLLMIESDEMDFVRRPADLAQIEQRIRTVLADLPGTQGGDRPLRSAAPPTITRGTATEAEAKLAELYAVHRRAWYVLDELARDLGLESEEL